MEGQREGGQAMGNKSVGSILPWCQHQSLLLGSCFAVMFWCLSVLNYKVEAEISSPPQKKLNAHETFKYILIYLMCTLY